jgi:hypothetical protein
MSGTEETGGRVTQIEVSKHAYRRLKERLGLRGKAAIRWASRAFKDGSPPSDYQYKPVARKFARQQMVREEVMYLIYRDMVCIFALAPSGDPRLVTLYDPLIEDEEERETFVQGQRVRLDAHHSKPFRIKGRR